MNMVAVSLIVSRASDLFRYPYLRYVSGSSVLSTTNDIGDFNEMTRDRDKIGHGATVILSRDYVVPLICTLLRFFSVPIILTKLFIERGSPPDNKIIDNHYRRNTQRKESEDSRK